MYLNIFNDILLRNFTYNSVTVFRLCSYPAHAPAKAAGIPIDKNKRIKKLSFNTILRLLDMQYCSSHLRESFTLPNKIF